MKLKTVSPDFINKVKELHTKRIKVAYEISLKAIELVHKAHENYKNEFKYSILNPLTFKPVDFNTFEQYVFGGGGIYSTKNEEILSVLRNYIPEIEKAKFIDAWWYKTKFELLDKKEHTFLTKADVVGNLVFNDRHDDLDFYSTLMHVKDFGELEFSHNDVERIGRWVREINSMNDILKDYGK